MKRFALLLVVAFLIGAGDAPPKNPLSCTISGDATCQLGTPPNIQVSIKNETGEEINLVGSLDGSARKARYPYCYFEITRPADAAPPEKMLFCGNTNPLQDKDFVAVPAGGEFDPYMLFAGGGGFFGCHQLRSELNSPGVYRIRFVYATNNDDIKNWAGDGRITIDKNEGLKAQFAKVPRCEVRSEEIQITVLPKE